VHQRLTDVSEEPDYTRRYKTLQQFQIVEYMIEIISVEEEEERMMTTSLSWLAWWCS
jgi:hypothetical protein